jgi:type II secretory pathway component PulK
MRLLIFQQLLEPVKNNPLLIRRGQTLVVFLIFILVAVTIATTSVSIIISNAESTRGAAQSLEAYYAAEAGIENATLQLLRNVDYAGETIQINSTATAEISVSHNGSYRVISTGRSGVYTRAIQANLDYTNNVLSVISWQELFQ